MQRMGMYSAASMFGIAIHGGAGGLPRAEMTPQLEGRYRSSLEPALDMGYQVLEKGGSSLDAVTIAVRLLEDNELFNAGRGAVFNRDGLIELDAAVMEGTTLKAGAVAGVKHIRNPVDVARLVMEQSPHVLLIGAGAEEFALQHGVTLVPNRYFYTKQRRRQLERALSGERAAALKQDPFHTRAGTVPPVISLGNNDIGDNGRVGTVGAVARDRNGHLAAATSTGGLTAKLAGRVGDSPIIGAGTYANDRTCAVSGTGHGEIFMRSLVAYDIHALMDYRQMRLQDAVTAVVQQKLPDLQAEGGVIAIDARGNIATSFNSAGMFRGARDSGGRRETAIY
jgi:beta-aspartyl-peptidase (threonine type)